MFLITKFRILDVSIIFLLLFILAYIYMTRKFEYWKKLGVTEITPIPFVGNFGDCLIAKRSAGQWLQDIYNFGTGLRCIGFYIFDRPCLLIRDPELIKNILIRDFNFFENRFASASPNDSLTSTNLFFVKSPSWKSIRTKLTPIFTTGKLKKMFQLMLKVGDDLDDYMNSLNLGEKGDNLELKDFCAKFTTDMIATTAFGIRVNSLNNPDAEFRKHGREIFKTSICRNIELISIFFLPNIVDPLGIRFFSKKSTQFLRQSMLEAMSKRERSGVKRNDFIDVLVELRKNYRESTNKGIVEFDGDTLVAQLAVFFTAGFETSSTTLSFTLYELALNPEIQSKLRRDIIKAIEESNGEITYETAMTLPYLDMVVAETLRMYPSLPFLDRVANDNYKIPDSDLIIEKGTPIFVSLTGSHCNPQYFPDPYKFDPERFSDENKKSRKSCIYIPFGEGPRTCIGMRIGLLQSKLGLIKLLTKYEFSPCKDSLIPMRISSKNILTTADGGLFLNVKRIAT